MIKSVAGAAGLSYGKSIFSDILSGTVPVGAGKYTANALRPVVQAEEMVYHFEPANNGADPMWCKGSTCLVRIGNRVFASGLETIADKIPLNNCRWMLFERLKNGWKMQLADNEYRTREPSPLAAFKNGQLFLSANPSLADPKVYSGPARPEILLFKASDATKPIEILKPGWADNPKFTEHSYRSFSADGARGELILFQNIGDSHSTWAFRDSTGKWSAQGRLDWPWGAEYERPEPIRVCYPTVMLKDRKVYFLGVSDIIEPKKAWREYKKQITGRDWDYDFRRLFLTWSDDITTGKFQPWIEIASREDTCGWIDPCDLWIAPDGAVHMLWNERAIDERLREKFFPEARQSVALNYAIFHDSKVVTRRTLALSEEGGSKEVPGSARFQVTPDNRLFAVYFVGGTNTAGQPVSENRIIELKSGEVQGLPVRLPLKQPFTRFFTATVRAGSSPSNILDMLGTKAGDRLNIHYAQVKLM
jgi:hypothetical protein